MTSLDALIFTTNGKTVTFPAQAKSLPGLSPAATDAVLDIIGRHAVDPKSVDLVAATMAQAKFAVEVSSYSLAETLRRMARDPDIAPWLHYVRTDVDFDVVVEAFKLVVQRNPAVFGDSTKAKPAEPAAGN